MNRMLKREIEIDVEETSINLNELEGHIAEQNKEYYEVFDNVAKYILHEDRVKFLTINDQFIPKTVDEVSICSVIKYCCQILGIPKSKFP